MKKLRTIVILIMALCLAFGLTACGGSENSTGEAADGQQTEFDTQRSEESEPVDTETRIEGKDALVAYFSATGTTKGVAGKIADITNADLYEIVPANPYSSADLNYDNSQSRTTVEMNDPDARPEIGSKTISLDGYSTLYLGYPIWWGEAPRIMSTFVEHYDFEGITVIPFCTSGGSGIGQSSDQLSKQAESGTWLSGERFSGSISELELRAWIDGLQ